MLAARLEFRNLTTSRLVGGEDGGLGGQLVTTSPRPSHDATIINGSMSTVVDLQCQYNGHNMYNVTDGTNIPGVLLKSTNEVVG